MFEDQIELVELENHELDAVHGGNGGTDDGEPETEQRPILILD